MQDHVFVPLSLDEMDMDDSPEAAKPEDHYEDDEDEVAVNWEILSNTSKLLTRLQDLSQTDDL